MNYTFTKLDRRGDASGEVELRAYGVDFGNGSNPLIVWSRNAETIAIKVPSGSHWAGRGSTVSHPGYYIIGKVLEETETSVKIERLLEMPLTARGGGRRRAVAPDLYIHS